MKKLLTLALIAMFGSMSLTSCTNESDSEIIKTETPPKENVQNYSRLNEMWNTPSENPYELDGYFHINAETTETIYMGQVFKKLDEDSEHYKQVIADYNSVDYTSRRVSKTLCSARGDNFSISFVNVCDSGNCDQYFVYTFNNGAQLVHQDTSHYPVGITCAALYIYSL